MAFMAEIAAEMGKKTPWLYAAVFFDVCITST